MIYVNVISVKSINHRNSKKEKHIKTSYDKHLMNKNKARQIKNADKERVIHLDPNYLCEVSFDMQKVLITPQAVFIPKGSLLHIGNLKTVYDIGKKLGYLLFNVK